MPKITMGEVFEDMKDEFFESLTVEQKRDLLVWCDEKIENRKNPKENSHVSNNKTNSRATR